MKRTSWFAASLGVLALLVGSLSAQADDFPYFTVDEGSVPGALNNVVEANKFTGSYNELITIAGDGTVTFQGFVEWASLVDTNGPNPLDQIGCLGDNCYNAYTIFSGSGTFDFVSGTFSIDVAQFDFYIDPDQDTTAGFGLTGSDPVVLAGTGDDYLVASATNLIIGEGIPGTPGAFLAVWNDLVLTALGEGYFVEPKPFYMVVETTGDFDRDTFQVGTFEITGDVSAVFQVPEPASIALFGLGLLGLAVAMRRRSFG